MFTRISPSTQVNVYSDGKNASKGLPRTIMSALKEFKASQDGCLLIKGLPIEEVYLDTRK